MKIKAQEIIIPALLFILMFILFDSCVKKETTHQTNPTDTTAVDIKTEGETWTWEIQGTRLLQVDLDGKVLADFDLELGVTMSVNDTIVGGVVLDDPLSIYTNQLDCFDPATFSYEIKGDEICFSDLDHEVCIPWKDCQSFVWILQDGRICVYIQDDCMGILQNINPDLKPSK